MNKYIILVFAVLIFFSENNFAQSSNETSDKELAIKMMEAILHQKTDVIKEYQPDVTIVRKLTADKYKASSDEQIKEEILAPLLERFQGNMDNIQSEIKEEKIDLNKVAFKDYTIEKMGEGEFVPSAMSIQFTYNDKEESIPLSILKIDDKWYIFEILISTNIFKE